MQAGRTGWVLPADDPQAWQAVLQSVLQSPEEARRRGAKPVFVTSMHRHRFDAAGKVVDTLVDYPKAMRETARDLAVPLIDLHKSSEALIVKEGVEGSRRLFLNIPPNHFKNYKGKEEDNTHFSEYGAASMASLVCQAIKEQNLALAKYLRPSDFKEKFAFELPKIYSPHFRRDT